MKPFTDVPVQRPSVGAMAVTTGSQMPSKITKPYVYQGTGEDQYEKQFPETEQPKPTKAELRERARCKTVARQRRADKARATRERNRQRREKEREEHRARLEAKRAAGWVPGDEGRAAQAQRRAERAAEREAARQARLARAPRPAPGWKPMTGADLLDALEKQ